MWFKICSTASLMIAKLINSKKNMQLYLSHKTELDLRGQESFGTPKRAQLRDQSKNFVENQTLAQPKFENKVIRKSLNSAQTMTSLSEENVHESTDIKRSKPSESIRKNMILFQD